MRRQQNAQTLRLDTSGVATTEVALPVGGSVVLQAGDSPVEVRLKRYADTYPAAADATLAAYDSALLGVAADRAPITRWTAELRSPAAFAVCAQAD